MKPVLSEDDKSQLEKRIAEAEKLTKIQIVLATVKRSDSYPEIPWKAFALGVSITGLLVFSLDMILFSWIQDIAVLVSVVAILAVAAFVVQMTILFPRFARLFLSGSRAESETRQYADSLFLSRELFSTVRRTGILLLISQFERKVIILPDKGLRNYVSDDDLKRIIGQMKRSLQQNKFRQAMEIALDEIIRIAGQLPSDEQVKNELSDRIIEAKGI